MHWFNPRLLLITALVLACGDDGKTSDSSASGTTTAPGTTTTGTTGPGTTGPDTTGPDTTGTTGMMCSGDGQSCASGEMCCEGLECCAGVPIPPGMERCLMICPVSDRNAKTEFAALDVHDDLRARLDRMDRRLADLEAR
jgi:hypothetical protein